MYVCILYVCVLHVCVCILIQRPNSSHNGNTSRRPVQGNPIKNGNWLAGAGKESGLCRAERREGVADWESGVCCWCWCCCWCGGVGLSGCCKAQDEVQNVLNSQFICKFILSPMLLLLCCCCCLQQQWRIVAACLTDSPGRVASIHIHPHTLTHIRPPMGLDFCGSVWLSFGGEKE